VPHDDAAVDAQRIAPTDVLDDVLLALGRDHRVLTRHTGIVEDEVHRWIAT